MVKGLECWAKNFILYFLCNGETLKIVEGGRKHQILLYGSSSNVRISQDRRNLGEGKTSPRRNGEEEIYYYSFSLFERRYVVKKYGFWSWTDCITSLFWALIYIQREGQGWMGRETDSDRDRDKDRDSPGSWGLVGGLASHLASYLSILIFYLI